MNTATVAQIEQLIDQLSPLEQVRLLEYLAPRIRDAVLSLQPSPIDLEESLSDEWITFFQIGDEIANLPGDGEETMTQSVTTMRR